MEIKKVLFVLYILIVCISSECFRRSDVLQCVNEYSFQGLYYGIRRLILYSSLLTTQILDDKFPNLRSALVAGTNAEINCQILEQDKRRLAVEGCSAYGE